MPAVPEVICSKCQGCLLEQQKEENEIAVIPCGHVFHKICIKECLPIASHNNSYGSRTIGKICPKCASMFGWVLNSERATGQVDLKLEKRDNTDYLELQSAYEAMEEKTKLAEEELKSLKEDCQRLASEVSNLETANTEISKRMITAEIKLTLLTDPDLLEKFGELKWNQLTPTFQKELLGKLQICLRAFINLDEILPINSKALLQLIKAGGKDETLLKKIIEDYYEGRKQPNGKVVWEDLNDSLRAYLTSKLRKTSQVESLELNQVPLSSSTLVHLVKDKTQNNPGYLGKIVAGYVDEMANESLTLVNDLFKVALLECVKKEVMGCVDITFLNPEALERLVELGMLRKESKFGGFEAFEFVHDCVRHCITGMIMGKLIEQVKVSRMNAFKLFYEGYTNPLGVYFADYMSEVEQSYLAKFAFVEIADNTLANLFMTLSVMRLPSLEPLIAVLNHCSIDVHDIKLSRKEPPEDMTLTLLHAAGIVGDVERVKCLLYEFGFSKELSNPNFQNLLLACVENTKGCGDEEIEQRKEIINELLELNWDLVNCNAPSTSQNVHEDLNKFMIRLGEDYRSSVAA